VKWAGFFNGETIKPIAVTYTGASFVVNAVPLPVSGWLFSIGLAAKIGTARRRST
jgi:hypothetical protein